MSFDSLSPPTMRPLFEVADNANRGPNPCSPIATVTAGAWSRPTRLPMAVAVAKAGGSNTVADCASLPNGLRGVDAEVLNAQMMWIGCGCNPELVRTYLLQSQSGGSVEEMREQVARRDYEEVRRTAHRVRGRVAYLYAGLATEALEQLHEAARAAHKAPSDDAHARVVGAFARAEAELERLDATVRRLRV